MSYAAIIKCFQYLLIWFAGTTAPSLTMITYDLISWEFEVKKHFYHLRNSKIEWFGRNTEHQLQKNEFPRNSHQLWMPRLFVHLLHLRNTGIASSFKKWFFVKFSEPQPRMWFENYASETLKQSFNVSRSYSKKELLNTDFSVYIFYSWQTFYI